MTTISARSHPTVARFRETRDGRDETSLFIEGRRLLEEFLDSPLIPREAAVTPTVAADARTVPLLEALRERGAPVHLVTPSVMDFLSDLETPPGIAVRAERPAPLDMASLFALGSPTPFIVLLDALQSPANVGAILRSAEAGGASAVGVRPGTADPLSPKALRASAGSAFRMPLFRCESVPSLAAMFPTPPTVVVADAAGPRSYNEWDWRTPCILLLGGETRGVTEESFGSLPAQRIKIPMAGRVESLNVAVAAGILLIEARRQRSQGKEETATA
jgi:TrmH family RNA methyltransferase